MDFGAAFSFVTADSEWTKKLGIASVVALAGVLTLGLALIPLVGYAVAISRRVSEGSQPVLPEWSDFGQLVMDGVKVVAIGFVWALPLILLSSCIALIGALVTSQTDDATLSTLMSTLISCISLPYGLLLALIQPAAIGHLARTGNFGQALNPLNAFKILRANFGGFAITALFWIILFPILQSIGLLICIIGLFPAIAYGTAVFGHLIGQAYSGAQATGFELSGA